MTIKTSSSKDPGQISPSHIQIVNPQLNPQPFFYLLVSKPSTNFVKLSYRANTLFNRETSIAENKPRMRTPLSRDIRVSW